MTGRMRIMKFPKKEGSITREQIKKAVMNVKEQYIKIGRIGEMEIKIHLEVQKVDNGFILFKDIYGIKGPVFAAEDGREVFLKFPEVRKRITDLLAQLIDDLNERISRQVSPHQDD